MFKFLLVFCVAVTTISVYSQDPYLVNQVLLAQKCQKTSPIQNLKYGYEYLNNVQRALFCDKYASRTCCSPENFKELEYKWIRTFIGAELSSSCYDSLSTLFCYDCDGDVGQELRQGLCEGTCNQLYNVCRDDLFSYDQNHPDRLVPCKKDTLFCSKLKDIISDSRKFCPLLGHKINPKKQFDDHFLVNLVSNISVEPPCFDMTPSSSIWGRVAPEFKDFKTSAPKLQLFIGSMFIYILYLLV